MAMHFAALHLALAFSSAPVELTICEALIDAARESGWPIAVDDDVPCGVRRAFDKPADERARRSSGWALEEAVNRDGLVVEERRVSSRVRRPTAEESTFIVAVAKRCKLPKERAVVVSVQTTKNGTRGWTMMQPTAAESTPLGKCVAASFADVTDPRFPDDSVVKMRIGSVPLARPVVSAENAAKREDVELALARAMEEHGPRVMRCFANASGARGVAAQATVRFSIVGGSVQGVEIVSTTAEGGVPDCVVDRLSTAHFDDDVLEGQRVTYTFRHAVRVPMLGGVPDEMP
jgi:hypothetical protein